MCLPRRRLCGCGRLPLGREWLVCGGSRLRWWLGRRRGCRRRGRLPLGREWLVCEGSRLRWWLGRRRGCRRWPCCGWRRRCCWCRAAVIAVSTLSPTSSAGTAQLAGAWQEHRWKHARSMIKHDRLRLRDAPVVKQHAHNVGAEWPRKAKETARHTAWRELAQMTRAVHVNAAAKTLKRAERDSALQQPLQEWRGPEPLVRAGAERPYRRQSGLSSGAGRAVRADVGTMHSLAEATIGCETLTDSCN